MNPSNGCYRTKTCFVTGGWRGVPSGNRTSVLGQGLASPGLDFRYFDLSVRHYSEGSIFQGLQNKPLPLHRSLSQDTGLVLKGLPPTEWIEGLVNTDVKTGFHSGPDPVMSCVQHNPRH